MGSGTSFGPQGLNATNTLNPVAGVNRYGTGVDTWVKDASSPTAKDGTVLDAAFFNRIIGNLRGLVAGAVLDGAVLSVDESNMSLVLNSVKHFAQRGFDDAVISPGAFKAATEITLAPAADRVIVYDASANVSGFTTPYKIADAVLAQGAGITLSRNAVTGKITVSAAGTLSFTGLPASGGVVADTDAFAFRTAVGGAHKTITLAGLRTKITQSIKPLPANGVGYLYNDGAGNLTYGTPAGVLPANGTGQLTNDGSGTLNYVKHLPLVGGQMGGTVDMVTHIFRAGRVTFAQLASLDAAVVEGAILYATGMGGTGYTAGPVFSDGVNWRKVMNNEIVT